MPKVRNTKRQPLDIEIEGDGDNLNLGPHDVSRELSTAEMKSAQVQANINAGNLVVVEDAPKRARATEKDGDN